LVYTGLEREETILMAHDRVTLNVGGKYFVTSRTTLANAGRGSMLAAVIDENWQLVPDVASDELFIDRNPAYFSVLLDLLRTGELHIPPDKNSLWTKISTCVAESHINYR
jgi:hypothetical protein